MYSVKHIYRINYIPVHAVEKKTGHTKINRSLQEKNKSALKKITQKPWNDHNNFSGNTVWFKKDSN